MDECPLGIVEIDGPCAYNKCRNRNYCAEMTEPWCLPYIYERCHNDEARSTYGYLEVTTRVRLNEMYEEWEYDLEWWQEEQRDREIVRLEQYVDTLEGAGWSSPSKLPYIYQDGVTTIIDVCKDAPGYYPAVPLDWAPAPKCRHLYEGNDGMAEWPTLPGDELYPYL